MKYLLIISYLRTNNLTYEDIGSEPEWGYSWARTQALGTSPVSAGPFFGIDVTAQWSQSYSYGENSGSSESFSGRFAVIPIYWKDYETENSYQAAYNQLAEELQS